MTEFRLRRNWWGKYVLQRLVEWESYSTVFGTSECQAWRDATDLDMIAYYRQLYGKKDGEA